MTTNELFILTGKEVLELDQLAVDQGISSASLMESAGKSAATIINERIAPNRVVIVAGKGGNGGDGLVIARALYEDDIDVYVYAVAKQQSMSATAATMAGRLEQLGVKIEILNKQTLSAFEKSLQQADCVVDGLLGVGVDRPLGGIYEQIVNIINRSDVFTVAQDLPSGVACDQGQAPGETIAADLTIAMQFLKPAHMLHPARESCGEIFVGAVDYPSQILSDVQPTARVLEPGGARELLPERNPAGHKGTFGRVLIIAGSKGMSGAAILASRGVLRAGAGLVMQAVPESLEAIVETAVPEAITVGLPEVDGHIVTNVVDEVGELLETVDVVAIGPGLSRARETRQAILLLLAATSCPVVIDADALFALSGNLDVLAKLEGEAVLTPHPGELSRLVGLSNEQIDKHRIEVARKFAKDHGVCLLLKGNPTAIASKDGDVYLNPTGNTGLATGGSGDVLTGVISGLMATGVQAMNAACLGSYIHGLCADLLTERIAERSIIPSDLLDELPRAIAKLENSIS